MKKAPYFSLQDQDSSYKSLKDYAGKWIVLYFYPRDNTPGCTAEACSFRDARDNIATVSGASVIGVSRNSVKSHKSFADRHKLNFTLLSDPEHKVIEAYGAWQTKMFLGKELMGVKRNTYIIDPKGNIVKEYIGVNPSNHSQQIISDLKELNSNK